MNAKLSKTLVNDLCDGCNKYCTIKELLQIAAFTDPRTVTQIKCVEIFKFERSVSLDEDIGWEQALTEWSTSSPSYAKIFDDIYRELVETKSTIHPRSLYNMIIERYDSAKKQTL